MIHSETMKQHGASLLDAMHEMLQKCTPEQRDVFRRMYNHKGIHARDVDGVKPEKMDWAFSQIETTLKKNEVKG